MQGREVYSKWNDSNWNKHKKEEADEFENAKHKIVDS